MYFFMYLLERLQSFDQFLIDKAFQPISDRVANVASCHQIASFLFTGYYVGQIFVILYYQQYDIALVLIVYTPFIKLSYQLSDAKPKAVLPAITSVLFVLRLWLLPTLYMDAIQIFRAKTVLELVDPISHSLLIFALYFMACRRSPPRFKRHVPSAIHSEA